MGGHITHIEKDKKIGSRNCVKMGRTIFLTLSLHWLVLIHVDVGAFEAALLDLGWGGRDMHNGMDGCTAMKLRKNKLAA
jgi:hypothetical protein